MAHRKPYDDRAFWAKLGRFAAAAGRDLVLTALTLRNCVMDRRTPAWARAVILAALGYFIVPLDTIPDFAPAIGFTDDLAALAAAVAAVAAHLRPEHRAQAKAQLRFWFG